MLVASHARLASNLAISAYITEDHNNAVANAERYFQSFADYIKFMEAAGFESEFFKEIGVIGSASNRLGIRICTEFRTPPKVETLTHVRETLALCVSDVAKVLLCRGYNAEQKHRAIKTSFVDMSIKLRHSTLKFTDMPPDVLTGFGFNVWKSGEKQMNLVPLWAAYALKPEEVLTTVKGREVHSRDADKVRGRIGAAYWGIPV